MIAPVVDLGDRCVDCRRECGPGSELRDGAVPAEVERERWDGGVGVEVRRGWLCEDCMPHLCHCGEVALGADVHWDKCAAGCGERVGSCPACWVEVSVRCQLGARWAWRCNSCRSGLVLLRSALGRPV